MCPANAYSILVCRDRPRLDAAPVVVIPPSPIHRETHDRRHAGQKPRLDPRRSCRAGGPFGFRPRNRGRSMRRSMRWCRSSSVTDCSPSCACTKRGWKSSGSTAATPPPTRWVAARRSKARPGAGSCWTRGEVFVARTPDEVRDAFDDHALIFSLGIGSIMNVPIGYRGRRLGTMNISHEAGWFRDQDAAAGRLIASAARSGAAGKLTGRTLLPGSGVERVAAGGAWPEPELFRGPCAPRRGPSGRGAPDHRPDRPERRGQDHAVQLHFRRRAARFGNRALRRARHHELAARPHRLRRARPNVPDRARLSAASVSTRTCCCSAMRQPGERVSAAVLQRAPALRRESELIERAAAIAQRLNLARVLNDPAASLSGGQKKLLEIGRVLMARAEADPAGRAGRRRQPVVVARDRRSPARAGRRRVERAPDRASHGHDRAALRSRRGAGGGAESGRGHLRRAVAQRRGAGSLHGTAAMSLPPGAPRKWLAPAWREGAHRQGCPMSLLTVEGLVVGYGAADEVLKGVDFSVETGEIVGVIGPNGAGKSTLLKSIAGLLQARAREHPPQWRSHRRPRAARHQPPRRGLRAAGAERLSDDDGARESGDGRLHRSRGQPAQDRRGVRAVSHPGRAPAAWPRARCRAASARCWPWRWR